jgi:hypothetical protein
VNTISHQENQGSIAFELAIKLPPPQARFGNPMAVK